MDQNVIIALVIVGTILIVLAMACYVRKSTDLQAEANQTDYAVGKRSRRDRELEERMHNGGIDIRRALGAATPPDPYPILPPPIYPPNPLEHVYVPGRGIGWDQPWGRPVV